MFFFRKENLLNYLDFKKTYLFSILFLILTYKCTFLSRLCIKDLSFYVIFSVNASTLIKYLTFLQEKYVFIPDWKWSIKRICFTDHFGLG